jgi:hypothetical protein
MLPDNINITTRTIAPGIKFEGNTKLTGKYVQPQKFKYLFTHSPNNRPRIETTAPNGEKIATFTVSGTLTVADY